jgi:activating signal cointegrator 1
MEKVLSMPQSEAVMTLTIRQPNATLVVGGYKPIETRPWQTKYRGPLVIHAAAAIPSYLQELCRKRPHCTALREMGYAKISQLPLGAAVGMVQLIDCIQVTPENQAEWRDADGWPINTDLWRWLWVLEDPKRFREPVPLIGRQRLWPYPNILLPETLLAA